MNMDRGDEVANRIEAAWLAMEARVTADAGELQRRLARREHKLFRRPLRAHCVAIRASDHRVNDYYADIRPRHALSLDADAHPGRYTEHTVQITDALVKVACAPYEIGRPGEPADEVARKLGCGPKDLRPIRRSGELHTNPKPGLRGRHGWPVPLVYVRRLLDSTARNKRGPDEVFGPEWGGAHLRVHEGFGQTVTRVPRYRRIGGKDQFQGWRWICPCCRQRADILYYPQPHPDLAVWRGFVPTPWPWGQQHAPIFACHECHGVYWFHRTSLLMGWNRLVLHYSGGLLYGREVEKPAWLTAQQPSEHRPPAESAERLKCKRLLVTTTMNYAELGRQLGMTATAVGLMAWRICKREGVKGRNELREKLAAQYPSARQISRAG